MANSEQSMAAAKKAQEGGEFHLVYPEQEEAYWQPKPANGYVSIHVAPHRVPMDHKFVSGTQTVPPGGYVRLHSHDRNEEVLHFISGTGKAILDGVEYELRPGTTLFLGTLREHKFINDGDVDLHWAFFFIPAGIENFFREIGRPRTPGEAAPEPFERPADVLQIEARTVFNPASQNKE